MKNEPPTKLHRRKSLQVVVHRVTSSNSRKNGYDAPIMRCQNSNKMGHVSTQGTDSGFRDIYRKTPCQYPGYWHGDLGAMVGIVQLL